MLFYNVSDINNALYNNAVTILVPFVMTVEILLDLCQAP